MKLDDFTYKRIKAYIDNEMTPMERVAFEEELLNNDELNDIVNILEKMDTIYNDEDWYLFDDSSKLKEAIALFRDKEVSAFSEKIKASQTSFNRKNSISLKRIILYVSSVAAIGLILFAGYFFNNEKTSEELYATYYTLKDLPSFALKNNETNHLIQAEHFFKEKKYNKALVLFKSVEKNNARENPSLNLYIALTNSELENYDTAIEYLEKIEESNTIDQHKSYWFKALVYLKDNNREEAITTLKVLTQNEDYFNYQKGVLLLKELE